MTIEVEKCNRPSMGGGHCELPKGHEGKHFRAWPDGGGFSWSDESQRNLLKGYRLD